MRSHQGEQKSTGICVSQWCEAQAIKIKRGIEGTFFEYKETEERKDQCT